VMGILNVTPDSFYDGGRYKGRAAAVDYALKMVDDGVDVIDVGGESTRPGSLRVSVEEELSRVIPVIRAIVRKSRIPVSIDTMKSEVAEEAIKSGASIVNDVSGLKHDRKMAFVVSALGAGVIIMHMRGTPEDMQVRPRYKDVVREMIKDLKISLKIARSAGVAENKIMIDPGIGFGKTFSHNLDILNRLEEFKELKKPICIGTSRKSFIGKALDIKDPSGRLIGTIATCVVAIMKGADLIRVHDVKEAVKASIMTDIILRAGEK
jgi:dihydropteroate synthase